MRMSVTVVVTAGMRERQHRHRDKSDDGSDALESESCARRRLSLASFERRGMEDHVNERTRDERFESPHRDTAQRRDQIASDGVSDERRDPDPRKNAATRSDPERGANERPQRERDGEPMQHDRHRQARRPVARRRECRPIDTRMEHQPDQCEHQCNEVGSNGRAPQVALGDSGTDETDECRNEGRETGHTHAFGENLEKDEPPDRHDNEGVERRE